MRKVLSVFIAVCLVLSLFTGVFAPVPSARALSEGVFTYELVGTAPNQTVMTPFLGDANGDGTDERIVVETWNGTLRFWCSGTPLPICYGAPGMHVMMGRP